MTEINGRRRIFEGRDTPKKWGMSCFTKGTRSSLWKIGYISDEFNELCPFSSMRCHRSWCTTPKPYWFCRTRYWMPYWGKATEQRSELVKEIRTFWMNKWFDETIPEIKHWMLKAKPNLPKDITDTLPEYFEYPYEIKTY